VFSQAGGVGIHIARFVSGSAVPAGHILKSAAMDSRFLTVAFTDERKN
jgi:hypothetical protein